MAGFVLWWVEGKLKLPLKACLGQNLVETTILFKPDGMASMLFGDNQGGGRTCESVQHHVTWPGVVLDKRFNHPAVFLCRVLSLLPANGTIIELKHVGLSTEIEGVLLAFAKPHSFFNGAAIVVLANARDRILLPEIDFVLEIQIKIFLKIRITNPVYFLSEESLSRCLS